MEKLLQQKNELKYDIKYMEDKGTWMDSKKYQKKVKQLEAIYDKIKEAKELNQLKEENYERI